MFYEPIPEKRHFAKDMLYAELVGAPFSKIVDAFKNRIDNWYLEPLRVLGKASGHYAFTALALECLLIDTLSQFELGTPCSARGTFKAYVQKWLPLYGKPLKYPIKFEEVKKARGGKTTVSIKTFSNRAEILYVGFRCGILHEAHAPLYCSIDPGGPRVRETKAGKVRYSSDHSDCPSVRINPCKLADDLQKAFAKYIQQLKNKSVSYDTLRKNFRTKFESSFGLDISSATL